MLVRRLLMLCTMLVTFSATAFAQFDGGNSGFDPASNGEPRFLSVEQAFTVSFSSTSEQTTIRFDAQPTYYLYERQFSLEASLPNGQRVPLEFEVSEGLTKFDEIFQEELTVHYDFAELTAPFVATSSDTIISIDFQGCTDKGLCFPPTTWHFQLNDAGIWTQIESAPMANSAPTPQAVAPFSFWMLLSAFLGGLILNLMPCVFPVLALKATSFVNAGDNAKEHGWIYTLGVVLSFLAFALVISIFAAAGTAVGWGFHLQNPVMVSIIAIIFVAMVSVLLLDLPIANKLMGVGGSLQQGSTKSASFFTGLLAVVVASPCTAPFMGVAMGAALTQSVFATFLTFGAIGLGMASPILVMSYWPALIKRLPRPGAWMNTARELLAFPLLATVIYLIWVVGRQTGIDGASLLLCALLLVVLSLWLLKQGTRLAQSLAVISFVCAVYLVPTEFAAPGKNSDSRWLGYSPTLLSEKREDGPVFVDVTAAWCITCIANRQVLESDTVLSAFEEKDVTLIEADWTVPDEEISSYLSEFGRAGVPLYVYYPSIDAQPVVLPQILTESSLLEVLEQ
ncbi:MAG: thioredoxin family protein [Gammaproteobacteria bacterium]|nr:thioredoxin family protein [Gammaproteobacteria bacterium]